MRYIAYPQCCGARTIVEFGNTNIGFGGGDITVPEFKKFVEKSIGQMKEEKNTFLTMVLNTDQSILFHDTAVAAGFNCYAHNMYHPKYGNNLSFYLYVCDHGVNRTDKTKESLTRSVAAPIVNGDTYIYDPIEVVKMKVA